MINSNDNIHTALEKLAFTKALSFLPGFRPDGTIRSLRGVTRKGTHAPRHMRFVPPGLTGKPTRRTRHWSR